MTFRKGDIIAYSPQTPFRRDGYAEVHISWNTGEPYGQDTFDQNGTRLTDAELEAGHVLFSLDDFVERRFLDTEEYAPADVFTLETRKGIVMRIFLRRGAQPLPEEEVVERRRQVREQNIERARRHLLSPVEDQQYVTTDLPDMTTDEIRELSDTLRWVERASRTFQDSLDHLVRILSTGDGSLQFATVHTDEDHYELFRARRALDDKLAALRA